jgi:fermentation-respiration switch protein FrsA (DUF1100 family)
MNPKSRRYWMNLLLFAVTVLCLGLLAAFLRLGYQGAMNYVRPPRAQRLPDDTPARYSVGYQDITLRTKDGLALGAWYTPSQNGRLILAAHGHAGARSADMHALFARHGYGVVSWDFRAHGESEGDLCTLGYYETRDVEAALDFALAQPEVRHVGAWGASMGAATVIEAAAQRPEIEAVVADSAFPAIEEMVAKTTPVTLLHPFIRFFAEQETGVSATALRPIDRIGQISPRPVFIIQGEADLTVPSDSAHRLYAAAGEPRQLWIEPGIGHVQMYTALAGPYERRVIQFFETTLIRGR